MKRFEAILSSKQPDLLSYCNELTSTRDCLQAIRSIRDCKHHIHLAEMIVANRYASLLAERSTDSETGGKTTSTAVVTFGAIPLTAPPSYVNDAAAGTANSSVRQVYLAIRPLDDHLASLTSLPLWPLCRLYSMLAHQQCRLSLIHI